MKRIINFAFLAAISIFVMSCSSSRNTSGTKINKRNLSGLWTISDITVNLPADYKLTDVFDEAPYEDFKGSKWNLVSNGKGNYTLQNGTNREIYWSLYGKGDQPQLQFKKLMGEKARNVENGYRLTIEDLTENSFKASSIVDTGESEGSVTYTFTK